MSAWNTLAEIVRSGVNDGNRRDALLAFRAGLAEDLEWSRQRLAKDRDALAREERFLLEVDEQIAGLEANETEQFKGEGS